MGNELKEPVNATVYQRIETAAIMSNIPFYIISQRLFRCRDYITKLIAGEAVMKIDDLMHFCEITKVSADWILFGDKLIDFKIEQSGR